MMDFTQKLLTGFYDIKYKKNYLVINIFEFPYRRQEIFIWARFGIPAEALLCSKRLYGTQRQYVGIYVLFTICITITTYHFARKSQNITFSLDDTHRLVENRIKENLQLEKGTGCDMLKLDPFSPIAMKFNEYLPKVTCEGFDWVNCHKSECYVKQEILKNLTDVSCVYRDILYVNDQIYLVSDYIKVMGDGIYLLNKSDHVKVSCAGTELNRQNLLSSRWYGIKAGFRPVEINPVPEDRKDSFNVMILAFDSASHNGFIRKMPKSYKYLSERAVILNGNNIVGDATAAALYAMLTGKAVDELPDARKSKNRKLYVDEKIFIFHLLKSYGYRTAYFEDSPWIGTFQFKYNGFRRQPADHYLRAFFLEKGNKALGFTNYRESKHCIGAVPQYQMMMNLTDEVFTQFLQLDGKKFSFTIIGDISHDNFNMISTADEPLISFLESLASRRALEDTLIMIMGDHGNRFQPIRETYQGKLEERLPLVAILLPEKLKQLRPTALTALKHNRNVLTTPFDIHTTLLDVLGLKNESNKYKVPGSDLPRGLSLLELIPETRSCSEAGIIQHWCTCTKWFNVSQSNPMYNQVADVLAEYIDSISEEQRSKCEKRKLKSIESVVQQNVNNHLLKHSFEKEIDSYLGNPKQAPPRALTEYYQAKIILSPGRGVYEGTMMYNTRGDYFTFTQKDISRINAYGDESNCINKTHPHLIKYCYCKEKLQKQIAAANVLGNRH